MQQPLDDVAIRHLARVVEFTDGATVMTWTALLTTSAGRGPSVFSASPMPLSTARDKVPAMRTQRDRAGKRGPRGERGPAGLTGPRGPAGPAMAPADILAVVEDQFYDVRKRLDAQLTRTAEVQRELAGQRKEIADAP